MVDWRTVWITTTVIATVVLIGIGIYLVISNHMKKRKTKKETDQVKSYSSIFSKKLSNDLKDDTQPKETDTHTTPEPEHQNEHGTYTENPKLTKLGVPQPFDYTKDPRMGWRARRKLNKILKKELQNMIHVTMYMNNGMTRFLITPEENDGFVFKNGKYITDSESKSFSPDLNMWCYEFHEKFALPITQKENLSEPVIQFVNDVNESLRKHNKYPIVKNFKLQELKDSVESSGLTEIETAVNPIALKRFIDTNVILQVLGGAWFTKVIKILLIVCLILLVIGLVTMIAVIYNTGVLDKINLGG